MVTNTVCIYPEDSRSYLACSFCNYKNSCTDSMANPISTEKPKYNIPLASEANKMTSKNLEKESKIELQKASEEINKAILDGKFYALYDEEMNTITREKLENLGYEVYIGTSGILTISWE